MEPTYLVDEFFYEQAGIPRQHLLQVALIEATAKMAAIVESVLAANCGEPIRVNVDRIKEIVSDPGFAVQQAVDGDCFVYSIADRAQTQQLVDEGERRRALRRMGGRRN